jgi:HlyD family secretion protein
LKFQSIINDFLKIMTTDGSGQDRRIQRKRFHTGSTSLGVAALLLLVFIVYVFFIHNPEYSVTLDRDYVTVSQVKKDVFREYIPVNGSVIPIRTIFLDAVESGRVEQIYAEDGAFVEEGDTILVMSNNSLQLDVLNREAQILEQINNLQNTRLALQQERLRLRDELIARKYTLEEVREEYERISKLATNELVSAAEYSAARQNYLRALERLELLNESSRLDSLSTVSQLDHIENSLQRMSVNLDMVRSSLDYLVLRAPVSGQLSSFSVEIGESKSRGERLGQIDILDGYRIRAGIDEHYLTRVNIGQQASFTFAGQAHELEIMRVYPDVTGGRFDVDMEFTATVPEGIRRGQTVRLRLELGEASESVLLSRGGFFQASGGNWVFVLNQDRTRAERRPVRLGRQNPDYFEVVEGLDPGDYVITSSYDSFRDIQQVRLQ